MNMNLKYGIGMLAVASVFAVTAFTVLAATCYDLPRDLSKGSTGPDVAFLQEYLGVESVGYFGPKTLAAVTAFQAANGLPDTGFFGPMTRAKLKGLTCAPGESNSTLSLEVTTTQQQLENGRTEVLISAKPVSATARGETLDWRVFVGAAVEIEASYSPDGMSSQEWEKLKGSYDEEGNLKDFPMYFTNNHETIAIMQVTVSAYNEDGDLLISKSTNVMVPPSVK